MTQPGSSVRETNALYLFCQIQTKGTSPERTGKNKGASWPQCDFNTQEAVRIGKYVGLAHRKYIEAHDGTWETRGERNVSGKGDLPLSWRQSSLIYQYPFPTTLSMTLSIYRNTAFSRETRKARKQIVAETQS